MSAAEYPCPKCGVLLAPDPFNVPEMDGVTMWDHPGGHDCVWGSTTLSVEQWAEIRRLWMQARNVQHLGRTLREMNRRTAGPEPDTSDLPQDEAMLVIMFARHRREIAALEAENARLREKLEAAQAGWVKAAKEREVYREAEQTTRQEIERLRETMKGAVESLRLFWEEAGCQTHVKDALNELRAALRGREV